ncbi:MAG: 30S ribosomal protein S4 [Chloroflexota bacterium]|nr:30S ribosomal protein S4 [Chloroflexota bacterium]
MARYTGPVCKLCRREGVKLFLKGEKCFTKCTLERRPMPPGPHAQRRGRKVSDYGLQLREKQKTRRLYGVLEHQFRLHFAAAERLPGVTGENMLQILEMRLDNVVYRLGLADSRPQARQVVRHGHVEVNGHKVDIPSYICKVGDEVRVRETSKANEYFQTLQPQLTRKQIAPWMELSTGQMIGRIQRTPDREELDLNVNEQLVVEYYSR